MAGEEKLAALLLLMSRIPSTRVRDTESDTVQRMGEGVLRFAISSQIRYFQGNRVLLPDSKYDIIYANFSEK